MTLNCRVGVDKIKFTLSFPNYDNPDHPRCEGERAEYAGIMAWSDSVRRDDFAAWAQDKRRGQVRKLRRPAAITCTAQPLPSGGVLHVKHGRHTGCFRAWFEFNADKAEVDELTTLFDLMLPLGFESIFRRGRVPYCEVFLDIDGVDFEQLCFIDTALRTGNADFVALGTCYLGDRQGQRSITIYDKQRQLKQVDGHDIGHARLRLEGKLRTGFPVSDLPAQRPPIRSLLVVPRDVIQSSSTPAAQRLAALMHSGMTPHQAYQAMGKLQRRATREVLRQLAPDWWRPAQLAERPPSFEWLNALRGPYGGCAAGQRVDRLAHVTVLPHDALAVVGVQGTVAGGYAGPPPRPAPGKSSPTALSVERPDVDTRCH